MMTKQLKNARAVSLVLLLALLLTAGMLVLARRELKIRKAEAEDGAMRYAAEMETAAERLRDDRETGDEVLAVHHALSASEYAARAGLRGTAERFSDLAEDIRRHGILGAPVEETLDALYNGAIREDGEAGGIPSERTEDAVLPKGADERAQNTARQLLGETVPLRPSLRSAGDRLCYTCRNGYAVIDRKTGLPLEFSLSLVQGEDRMNGAECAAAAMRFLASCCPADRLKDPRVDEIRLENGFAGLKIRTDTEIFFLKIKRDTGRVCAYIAL